MCLYDKQNKTWLLVDMEFFFSCLTRHLTRSLRSLMSYWVKHSNRISISRRVHVLFSIYPSPASVPSNRFLLFHHWSLNTDGHDVISRECLQYLAKESTFFLGDSIHTHWKLNVLRHIPSQSGSRKLLSPLNPVRHRIKFPLCYLIKTQIKHNLMSCLILVSMTFL